MKHRRPPDVSTFGPDVRVIRSDDQGWERPVGVCHTCGARCSPPTLQLLYLWVDLHRSECEAWNRRR